MIIKIYSDAVCPWSYGEEKVLRAIDYIYYGKIKFRNIMGGLFSDYRDLLPINMKDQDSEEMANKILYEMWLTGYNFHNMPINKEYPKLLSPIKDSIYPIDIAFVAARLTNEELANKYLRALREATILEGRNTMKSDVQIEIAKEVGLDEKEYINNLENFARDEFLEDRMDSFDHRFTLFPNFVYINKEGKEKILKGYQKLEDLIEFIDENSNNSFKKREIKLSELEILEFIKEYKRVFDAEIYQIFKDKKKVNAILEDLVKSKKIEKNLIGTGIEFKIIK